jgi:hypothetical protein
MIHNHDMGQEGAHRYEILASIIILTTAIKIIIIILLLLTLFCFRSYDDRSSSTTI